ncbi:RNA polymerase II-associated protein 1 isoform X2 [Diachasma alloeum]|uniref:RNA polymerase II-associated protein 1 isoform X1 n=1 Tax=Diachasma alloeum TaxID=454923 RepID=UPI000738159B|nr:RNA polymerase II-associated protein 1 isoform X1 [Diachasma alloeum]XP_015116353.1 RNA polymerase II-associated protein 1 isoform X2 [Diachasma alloeum]
MNDPTTLKRPKPGDGEEELFRMQEEFLQSREAPSAKVINLRGKALPPSEPPKFRSKFAERRAMREKSNVSTSRSTGAMINPSLEEKIVEDPLDPAQKVPSTPAIILGNIIEKKFAGPPGTPRTPTEPSSEATGFPEVFLVRKTPKTETSGSLFHQNIKPSLESPINSARVPGDSEESGSALVRGPLSSEIHKENLEKLNKMTQEEILQEKARLESLLSPDVIKFIKAMKNSSMQSRISPKAPSAPSGVDPNAPSRIVQNEEVKMETDSSVPPPLPVSKILEEASENRWVHMDDVEPPKLEWMKDLEPSESPGPSPEEPYNARFSFEGLLLPFKDDSIPMDQGLHHHGEEPERPGYSLQELLQLSRSSTQQQRCTALTTIANIMEKSRSGWYDKVLEPAPLVALNSRNILLLLRFSIDDTSVAVVTAALQALRTFLYSEADEISLDRLSNWRYNDGRCRVPDLSPKTDVEDFSSLKDHELAQIDCVSAAVRSDILIRLRYILSEMRPTPVGVTAALEVLIRISRHSKTTALNIACTPNLLSIIVRHFVPLTTDRLMNLEDLKTAYDAPNVTALRLLRILVEYGGKPVADRLHDLKIVNSLLSYVTSEPGEAGLRLSIEALRLWKTLLSQGVSSETVGGARLILGSHLQLLLTNHDLQASELASEHAAGLVAVANYEPTLQPVLATLLAKWSTQLRNLSSPTWSSTNLVSTTLTSVKDISSFRTEWVNNPKIFEGIILASNLLSGRTTALRNPESLPALGVLTERGEVQPIVAFNSCTLFLSTAINLLYNHSMTNELMIILSNPYVMKYLRRLSTSDWSLGNSWFTRPELYLLTGLIKAMKVLPNGLPPVTALKIGMKLLSTLPADAPGPAKDLLKLLISNERLNMANLSQELNSLKLTGDREEGFQLPSDVSAIYEGFINPGSWDQPVLPRDWPYLPLVASYTRHKEEIKWEETDTLRIITLLSLEVAMPELFDDLSPTLRFSRLILIYLCDGIHLDQNVSVLLKKVIPTFLAKFYKRLDFSNDVPGVTSFPDLFAALCEGFCANSYGDDGFAAAVMAFVAQRHDKYYRKILWSEHAGALRYIRLTPQTLPIPIEEYVNPGEDDMSLIEVYLTALVRGTVKEEWSPLMYTIAVYQSGRFLRGEGGLQRRMRERVRGIKDKKLMERLLEGAKV